MFFLMAPLLIFGFFWPRTTHSVEVVKNKFDDHLIALRDYDFVGEDSRLSGLLAERMKVLQTPVDLSDLEADTAVDHFNTTAVSPAIRFTPDQLQLDPGRHPRVNVSLDYAEMIEVKDFNIEGNASGLAALPGEAGNLSPSRRYEDPSYKENNMKILDIMRQIIYNVQGKLLEVEPIVSKYQTDVRFRMAYIYDKLEEWKKDMRTIFYAMIKKRKKYPRFKVVLWYYEHLLRKSIDVTYTIEHLTHLHTEYMKTMKEIGKEKEKKKDNA